MTGGVYRKMGLATLIMTVSVFLSRALGVLRESTIAALGGAGVAVDAYKAAFILPEILNHLLASGFLSITFIPIVARYLAQDDAAGAWRIASTIITLLGGLLALLTLAAMVLTPQLIAIVVPGRDDPQFQAMAIRMTRILLPAQLFFFAGGIFMAVQFVKERFLVPALAPLIYNLGIILGGLLLTPRMGVEGFAWGALAGALIGNCLLQWIGARRAGLRLFFSPAWRHPDLSAYIRLTLPLMVGLTMTFSTEIFSKFFGSYLPAGAIAHIDYAWRIMLVLVAFFGQAVGVAAYPFMARLAAQNQLAEMNRLLNNTLRYLALVIPMAGLLLVVRHEVVRILFERRAFLPADTQATALALAGMLLGAAAFAAQTVVNRGFYATRNTLLPSVYGSAAVIAGLPLYWIGMTTLGVLGVGLAISCSALIQVVLLYTLWNRRSGNSGSREVYRFYGKSILLTIPVAVLLLSIHRILLPWIDTTAFAGSLLMLMVQGVLFLLLMAVAARLFNIEEARILRQRIQNRFSGKHKAHSATAQSAPQPDAAEQQASTNKPPKPPKGEPRP
ncbi:murein biosynthesis integral membrane protein MurJ [Desulfatitalea alkaliphila]|uniref:Probable lipid II flippase MurJ n=1 Tax=Desulfatitalea alkaliphila TaxID=2929485 RepID=A0AA41R6F9_9BACT|nr:murein biosynthesis integral membrane protein MurJ [Desulfatitalea alkaliphila]MCJ8502293.1 murein biosynthesis integral membrane protein MurJ [Desulfatitalea alkaliphila]